MVRYRASKNEDSFILIKLDNVKEFNNEHSSTMQTLIDCFNSEYKWDDMFSVDDVVDRLNNGHTLFILWQNGNPMGYIFFKEIKEDVTFLYNFYVTKVYYRDKTLPIKFVNEVCRDMFKTYNHIELECEDWNTIAQRIFETNDFKRLDD